MYDYACYLYIKKVVPYKCKHVFIIVVEYALPLHYIILLWEARLINAFSITEPYPHTKYSVPQKHLSEVWLWSETATSIIPIKHTTFFNKIILKEHYRSAIHQQPRKEEPKKVHVTLSWSFLPSFLCKARAAHKRRRISILVQQNDSKLLQFPSYFKGKGL